MRHSCHQLSRMKSSFHASAVSLSTVPTSRTVQPAGHKVFRRRTDYPEQRPASLCHRGRHERAGHPRSQLSTAVERCAKPGPAGHPAQPSKRGNFTRPVALGPHPSFVPGPDRRPQADQRQVRLFGTCRHSGMRIDCAAVSYRWMAFSSGRRSRGRRRSSPTR
jgi:hypothetical protein